MNLETDTMLAADAVISALELIASTDKVEFSSRDVLDVLTIIRWESFGDPAAVNNEDINAKEGHPSQGLMQVIPTTFQQYALPGHDKDINDPLSNIIAGVRYARARYGSLEHVPGLVKLRAATQDVYVGY
jgi:SLT domain-containing protein